MALFKNLKKNLAEKPTLDVQQQVVRGLITAKLYALMQEAGLSKAALAGRLDVSKAAVTGWLNGNRNFTVDTLTQIAFACDKTPKIEFVPLNSRHEANLFSLPTAGTSVVKSQDNHSGHKIETSTFSIKIVSHGK
jgi:transcriptional regulator with XRE-family HTH domain